MARKIKMQQREAVVLEEKKTPEPVKVSFEFRVNGMCINTNRGILKPGTVVFESDFDGGIDSIMEHVEALRIKREMVQ